MDRHSAMDRRNLLRLAGLAGVAGLAGCGIASHGGVVVDGPGPSAGTGGSQSNLSLLPRTAASRPEDLVANFLSQATGDPANTRAAFDRWKSYMTDEFRKQWDTENIPVTVVWLTGGRLQEGEGADIKLIYDMVPLGRLEKNGSLSQFSQTPARKVTFTVSTRRNEALSDDQIKPDQTFYIKAIEGAPEGMLVSTSAMASRYTYRNLYFWDRSGQSLIPDGRYAPVEWEETTREKKLVEWLVAAPPQGWWLAGVAQPLPDGILMLDQPSKVGPNKLALNFNFSNNAADVFTGEGALSKFVSQLTWTLLPECLRLGGPRDTSPIVMKVDSIEKKTENPVRYLSYNPTAVKVAGEQYQQAFAIVEGRVRRVGTGPFKDAPLPLLSEDQNHDVEWAAYGSDRRTGEVKQVALVTRDSRGRTALLVGAGQKPKLLAVADLAGKKMTQPVFVDNDSLFVIANGDLYHVRFADRKVIRKVKATAFSVAADGRRMVYISGGRLNAVTLTKSDNGFTIGTPRPIPTILSNLNGVAFTGEGWLAVSGTYEDQTRVVEITLDGAMVGRGTEEFGWLFGEVLTPVVTSLTASLDDPVGVGPSRRIFLTANDKSRDATSGFQQLTAGEVGAPAGNPTNAFFL